MTEKTVKSKNTVVCMAARPHVETGPPVCAERRPTGFTGLRSVRCEPWLWIYSHRRCTWRCCFFWREWTTTPSSNRPATCRRRQDLKIKRKMILYSVRNITLMLSSELFHVFEEPFYSLNLKGSHQHQDNLLLYKERLLLICLQNKLSMSK